MCYYLAIIALPPDPPRACLSRISSVNGGTKHGKIARVFARVEARLDALDAVELVAELCARQIMTTIIIIINTNNNNKCDY